MRDQRLHRSRPSRASGSAFGRALPVVVVTITLILSWELFRIAHFMGFSYRCEPVEESWFTPGDSGWPLFGYFAFAFVLLFLLNAALLLDRTLRSDRISLAMISLNGIALLVLSVGLFAEIDTASLQYLHRHSGLDWVATRLDFFGPDDCERAKPFVGRWRVVSRSLPPDSDLFPYAWVNLRHNLTFETDKSEAGSSAIGRWTPPDGYGAPMEFWTQGGGDSLWDATLSKTGDLVLEVPKWQPLVSGRIRLARVE